MAGVTTRSRSNAPTAADSDHHMRNEAGKDLVNQLYVVLRTCKVYEPSNENYRRQLVKLYDALGQCFEFDSSATVHIADGYFFFNEERLRIDLNGYLATKYLQEAFQILEISGIRFDEGIEISTLSALFRLIAETLPRYMEDTPEDIGERMTGLDLPYLAMFPALSEEASGKRPRTIREKKRLAKHNFFTAINTVGEIVSQTSADKKVNGARVKRVVHSIVDQILSDETYLLELAALKNFDDYTFVHCVDVCIFSIAVGLRLGFNKRMLSELGFAAMFHDIGKTRLPVDLLNKPSELDRDDWQQVHEHPVHGVRLIGNSMLLESHSARAMIVSFEHHKNLDGTGYPYINRNASINLFSRIVAICDFFDALTSGRKYQPKRVRLDEAVRELAKLAGSKFDPLLVKVFINVVGLYPTGTLLLLDTGELAMVVSNNPEDVLRPRVKILANSNGLLEQPKVSDLTDIDRSNGRFIRSVSRVVDPEKYDIDISQFVLDSE